MASPGPGPRLVVSGRLGFILLGIWALISGVSALFGIHFQLEDFVLAVLLIAAGFLIVFGY